ncbi:MAG: fold metallo-hydrolase [Thermoleophilia bacterium]|nr:fold metallo-hydrolase [Thermoleophilia bacterium]
MPASSSSDVAPLVEIAPGIHQLQVPMGRHVGPVNAWMLEDTDGSLTVFDTGVAAHFDETWLPAIQSLGRIPGDVTRIIVSHLHPDHVGGSGPLHRLSGAPVWATATTAAQAREVWGDHGRIDAYFASVQRHLTRHGAPEAVSAGGLGRETEQARRAVELPPDDAWRLVRSGDIIDIGTHTWYAVEVGGHADGHLVLHDRTRRLLLSGDVVLEHISPAIGLFPDHDSDPLGSYIDSLHALTMLDVDLVLAGHGAPFTGIAHRCAELVEHHRERLDQCVRAVEAVGEASAYDVATRVFARVFAGEPPDWSNQRFAITEALAHLERARLEQRVVCSVRDHTVLFSPTAR